LGILRMMFLREGYDLQDANTIFGYYDDFGCRHSGKQFRVFGCTVLDDFIGKGAFKALPCEVLRIMKYHAVFKSHLVYLLLHGL
jgi:hypothetical protein